MRFLRSLAFNMAFFVWSAAIHVASLPLLAAPRRWVVIAGVVWIRGVMWLLRVLVGLDYEVRGLANVPDGPCLVAAKHQSAWDTMIFSHVLKDPAYVLKRELIWVPLLGWYLKRCRNVPVDRQGGAKALRRMLRDARSEIARGRPIVIFPEGTRMPPGETRRYHPGVAALYAELGVPVVPVALNSGLYWGRRQFRKKPGRIVLEFLPPIPAGLPRRQFMKRLHDDLESATEALVVEARSKAHH